MIIECDPKQVRDHSKWSTRLFGEWLLQPARLTGTQRAVDALPSKHLPLNKIFCSRRNFSSGSTDEKLSSLETALHFSIVLGRWAGAGEMEEALKWWSFRSCPVRKAVELKFKWRNFCSSPKKVASMMNRVIAAAEQNLPSNSLSDRETSSFNSHRILPVSASLRFIQLLVVMKSVEIRSGRHSEESPFGGSPFKVVKRRGEINFHNHILLKHSRFSNYHFNHNWWFIAADSQAQLADQLTPWNFCRL